MVNESENDDEIVSYNQERKLLFDSILGLEFKNNKFIWPTDSENFCEILDHLKIRGNELI